MQEEIRIGVFVCDCGINIAGPLDTEALSEFAKTLPHVSNVKRNLYTCSEAGTTEIANAIKEHNLNRVVVASCTPRTHEPVFRETCERAGLNPYLFNMVNIRDQCSWAHMHEREDATEKAKDLIRMGVAKAALLEPLEPIESKVEPKALVLGAGIAGLTASLSLAERGFKVVLLEKEKEMGGLLRHLHKLAPGDIEASKFIGEKIALVKENPNIEVFTSATLEDVKGFVGNFRVKFSSNGTGKEFVAGVIIVATGGSSLKPVDLYGYDGKNVITQMELEERLKAGALKAKSIVMIQCVGARIPERGYCSRICCFVAIKNCLHIREVAKDAKIFLLYRDIRAYGVENESLFLKAKEAGVRFLRYDLERPPVVGKGKVRIYSEAMRKEVDIPADLVILATPVVASEDAGRISKMLKIPTDKYNFFLEAHVKLRPLDFAADGIYLCGNARYPVPVREAISEALGAASRASIPLSQGKVTIEPSVSTVIEELCTGCGLCASLCPYGALEMEWTVKGAKVKLTLISCKGCGLCASSCPQKALDILHFRDRQIEAEIYALAKS